MNKKYTYVLFSSLLAISLGTKAQTSTQLKAGTISGSPVFSETFDTEADFKTFTVQNYNGGAAWQYDASSKAAVISHSLDEYKPACDDWLISPKVNLKAGHKYTLNFHIWGTGGWTTFKGEYAIAVGTGDDPKSFNIIKENTELRSDDDGSDMHPMETFTVSEDGEYHIGFQCTNNSSNDYGDVSMFVDDITLAESSVTAPGSVTDAEVKTDGSSLKATISFKAPTTDINGGALASIEKIDVIRDGLPVGSVANPEPGKEYSVTDESPAAGNNTWNIVAHNESGDGDVTTVSAWVGPDTPMPVTDIKLERTADGSAKLTWTAPAEGINGGFVDSAALTYTITRMPDKKVVSEGKTASSFTDAIDKTADGQVYQYSIEAVTADGKLKSDAATSLGMYFGKSHEVPYSEDFAADPAKDYTVIDSNDDGCTWKWSKDAGAMTDDYSWTTDANDWLLTPLIKLEGGWAYSLSFNAAANEDQESQLEKISAAYGTSGNPDDFTEIMPTTEYHGGDYTRSEKHFNIKQTDDYQIGFHLTSGALMWGVWFDDVKVEKFVKLSAPDSVKNIRVVAAGEGKLSATVTFNAPSQNAGFEPLQSITKIDLWRGDANGENLTLVHTFEAPEPGKELSFVDDKASLGYNYYFLRAYNGEGKEGEGILSSGKEYVGEDVPAAPTGMKATDNLDGTVKLTWNAPADKGVHNKWVNTKDLTYIVYSVDGQNYTELTRVKGVTEASVEISQQGPQFQLGYAVAAVTAGGTGKVSGTSNPVIGGLAYELPVKESFPGGVMSKAWWTSYDANNSMMQTYQYSAADNDGGSFLYFDAYGAEYDATVTSGKIHTEDGRGMQLSFAYRVDKDKKFKIKVGALKMNGEEVAFKTIEDTAKDGDWHDATVDISSLSTEKFSRLRFTLDAEESGTSILLDKILVKELLQYDLGVNSVVSPFKVYAGKDAEVTVNVDNNATETAIGDDYTVELYVNGEKALETPGEDIEPNETKSFNFEIPTGVNDKDALEIYAKIAYDYDLQDKNNTSETKRIEMYESTYPGIDDLAATDNQLTWSAPKSSKMSVIEDFEEYSNGQISGFEPWAVYDDDGAATLAAMLGAGLSLPNYDQPVAFMIFNPEKSGINLDINPGLVSHSGSQFITSFAGIDDEKSQIIAHDDMLVSPELSGDEQTITFWAKSLTSALPESFQVLTSSTTNEENAFSTDSPALDVKESTPDAWTKYEVKLPEGTKYFAIRSYGTEPTSTGYEFMLDDVKYDVAAPTLTGYNIYCDGKKAGSVKASEAAVFNAESGHTYNVTATYDDGGESKFSNDVKIGTDGIETVGNDADRSGVTVSDGKISVAGTDGKAVSVYTADGRLVYNGKAAGNTEISVPAGQYIIRLGAKAVNVVVK
ncbi:choice-of-anchor J domain-containing protein [uncultured Prevotella sp.]|uniref:choice-of-anchor J domain-containing protein n=1 Tax=uncultured Prevotella sp. TaxID=159272 RepID=UPI002620ED3B|nr:choice-of-anchor J domain-containing protein [uncultured Prevotella sp.]